MAAYSLPERMNERLTPSQLKTKDEAKRQIRKLRQSLKRDGGLRWPFASRELFRSLRKIKNTQGLRIDRPDVGERDPDCVECGEKSEQLGHVISHEDGVYEWGIHPRWLQKHGTVAVCQAHNKPVEWDEKRVAKTIQVLREAVEKASEN